jgi:hypothetical protein
MLMKWRARLTMLVVIGVALAASASPPLNRFRYISLAVALLGIVGVPRALSLFFFRCPHCRARQLRFLYDWLFIGDRCWRCHQALDSPARPQELIDEEWVAQGNPALAADMRRDRLALEELQARARTDPAAAARLEQELSAQVQKLREWVAIVGREAPSEVTNARRDLATAEAKLAECRSLPPST